MTVHQEGNFQLCPYAIGRGDENRLLITFQIEGYAPRKPTNFRQDLRSERRFHHGFDRLNKGVPLLNIYPCTFVRKFLHPLPLPKRKYVLD